MGLTDKHLAYGDDIPQTQAEKDYYWALKDLKEKQQVSKKYTDMTIQETVEVVIRLPKNIYKTLEKFKENGIELGVCETAILNGISLPKGHGRLIDADAFCEKAEADRKHSCYLQSWTADDVMLRLKTDYAPTVIEAYKENK